jgi:mycothiol synthase
VTQPSIRHSGPDDAAAIAAVANAISTKLYGEADVSEESIRHWFELPHLTLWVAELDGRVIGHCDVSDEDRTRFEADIRVHPDVWGQGVTAALLATAETWGRERAEPDAVMRTYAGAGEEEQRGAVEARGYRPVRHFFRMHIELDGLPAELADPRGSVLRAFDPDADDPERVYHAHMESFAGHWGFRHVPFDEWGTYTLEGPNIDPALWKLAEVDGELAGLSINSWHLSGDRSYGWVNVLGVRPAWRRRGLGLALLSRSFAEFSRRGATQVGLGVDSENETGAVDLYERAGMSVSRREATFERAL